MDKVGGDCMNSMLSEYGFDDAVFNSLQNNVKSYDVEKFFCNLYKQDERD